MTTNEFCRKYDVPRGIVYESTFWLEGDRDDFRPEEMAQILRDRIAKKKAFHQEKVDKLDAILDKIKGIRGR